MNDTMIEVGDDGAVVQEGAEKEGAAPEARRDHHAQRQPRKEGQFAGPPAPKEEAPAPKPTPPAKRAYEFTTDRATGTKKKVELGDEDIPNVLAKAHGFDAKARELAEFRKQVEQERSATKALQDDLREGRDPHRAMRKFIESSGLKGEKARDAATLLLKEYLEEDSLTDEQKELKRYREQEAERQRQEEEAEEQAAQEEFQKKVEERRGVVVKKLEGAFAGAAEHGLPVNEHTLSIAGKYLLTSMKDGLELTPAEIAEHVKAEYFGGMAKATKGMTGAQIRSLLPHVYGAVHRDLVEKAKGAKRPAAPAATPVRPRQPERQQGQGPVFYDPNS